MCLLLIASCGDDRVIVGAGTTTVDSGFMEELEESYGESISVVPGSTAQLLELAAQGSLSAVIVHDEAQELQFMANHPAARRSPAFESAFLLVGPPEAVAALPASDPHQAFAAIASSGLTFVTRGDGSGTHTKELAIWEGADIAPGGPWYISTGQGMGQTLQVADQLAGFTLVELGVFAAATDTIDLQVVPLEDISLMANPYSVIVVDAAGNDFFSWLTGPTGQAGVVAANDAVFDQPVYTTSEDP